MQLTKQDQETIKIISQVAETINLDLRTAKIRRTSSRFCFGVEHGDYNGTDLFGVGTDRFIWFAYAPNNNRRIRLYSGNFPEEGIIEFEIGKAPQPDSKVETKTWARFPFGIDHILKQEGIKLKRGISGIIYGDIPGGGMSRSASLTLNLILSLLDVNPDSGIEPDNLTDEQKFRMADLAQAVEHSFGSPCGKLDPIMIMFAREGMGTYYSPKEKKIRYIPFGGDPDSFRLVILDTGKDRPGLENSTYKIRREECEYFVKKVLKRAGYKISYLADVGDALYNEIIAKYKSLYPDLAARLNYIYHARQRFGQMIKAWEEGDIKTVGKLFNEDGIGLDKDYDISGMELEAMCSIAREVPGILGARMLGGGDAGAAGAIVEPEAIPALKKAVDKRYPQMCPGYKQAVHECKMVKGVEIKPLMDMI